MSFGVGFISFKVSVFSAMIWSFAPKIALGPRFHATSGLRLNRCIMNLTFGTDLSKGPESLN